MTVIVLGVFISFYITESLSFSLQEKYTYRNNLVYDSFEQYFEKIDLSMENFILGPPVQNSLIKDTVTAEEKESLLKVLSYFGEESYYYLYLDNKGNIFSQIDISFDERMLKNFKWYQILRGEYAQTKLSYDKDWLFGDTNNRLFVSRYVRHIDYNCEPGILCLRLNFTGIEDLIGAFEDDPAYYLLLNQHNKICYIMTSESNKLSKKEIAALSFQFEALNETYGNDFVIKQEGNLYGYINHPDTDFKVAVYVPKTVIIKEIIQVVYIIILVFLVVLLLAFITSNILAGHLAQPIKTISGRMKEFDESELTHYLDIRTDTELDTIGTSYNHMLDRISALMDEVKERERGLRESEMESLLYQIHPHFLYNTLDTIYMLARISKEKSIMLMIQSLSTLMRINLSKGMKEIPIQKELEHVAAYLEIQKIRNENLFTSEIDCQEEAKSILVIKLILQPLVENSIKHGFSQISEGGMIQIHVGVDANRLKITVKNNGTLINDEKIKIINQMLTVNIEDIPTLLHCEEGGYGIANVVKRLRLNYQNRIHFGFRKDDTWTICDIEVPVERNESKNEEKII